MIYIHRGYSLPLWSLPFSIKFNKISEFPLLLPAFLIFLGMMEELFHILVLPGIASILSLESKHRTQGFLVCCVHCSVCLMLNESEVRNGVYNIMSDVL